MTSVLIDERMSPECERSLMLRGFYPIRLPKFKKLPEPISSHPDSLVLYHGNRIITPSEYCEYALYAFSDIRERHPNIKLVFSSDELGNNYPNDCKMNARLHNSTLFARLDSLSPAIKEYAQGSGYSLVNVKQGYPACTSLIFGNSAITADRGLHKAFMDAGIRSNLIENGNISLPPYEYGFIGGASGVYKNKVYFIGDYKTHPSAEIIERAISKEGFMPVSLSSGPLIDLGGLIFIE